MTSEKLSIGIQMLKEALALQARFNSELVLSKDEKQAIVDKIKKMLNEKDGSTKKKSEKKQNISSSK